MRWVERAVTKPSRCAVIPFIGQGHEDGYIDTGSELDGFDNHVYVSVVAVREMARLINWVAPEEIEVRDTHITELEARVAELEAEVASLDGVFEAIDVLESRGYTSRKKAGRPKKEEVPA